MRRCRSLASASGIPVPGTEWEITYLHWWLATIFTTWRLRRKCLQHLLYIVYIACQSILGSKIMQYSTIKSPMAQNLSHGNTLHHTSNTQSPRLPRCLGHIVYPRIINHQDLCPGVSLPRHAIWPSGLTSTNYSLMGPVHNIFRWAAIYAEASSPLLQPSERYPLVRVPA